MSNCARSLSLLGIAEESCWIYDSSGRNGRAIEEMFACLSYPARHLTPNIRFDCIVEHIA
jgi:hypothetical protein